MMSLDQLAIEGSITVAAGIGATAFVQNVPTDGQQWTAMAMVGAVLFWLMYRVTRSCDAMAAAQSETAKALAVMTLQLTNAQTATDAKRTELSAKLDKLASEMQELTAEVHTMKARQ